mmetsp:Transcript_3590/g.7723  ORF Transcript_3590/g.7723 Transcript_3590/m.7723 type:complete len:301 (-) Transcript_3590:55-957(-)
MFNVYQFDKKLGQRQSQEDEAVKTYKRRQTQHKVRTVMSENYRRRVSQFIMNMMLDPIKVKEHQRPLEVAGRDSDPSLFKGRAIFITKGFKTEKQRIKEALDSNQFLESTPAYLKEVFRDRNEDKEVNPRMYFKPKTGLERVRDALLARNVEFYDDTSERPQKGNSLAHSQSTVSKKTSEAKDSIPAPKDLCSNLHRKTHFKALTSVMLGGQHSSLREVSRSNELPRVVPETAVKPRTEVRVEDMMKEGDMKNEEAVNLAKKVLETCRVRHKPGSVPVLKQGMGRLVSNPGSRVLEVCQC